MASLKFRLFGNLSFLQSLDKEKVLRRLLASHSDYFLRQGLDVNALSNDDACARQLLEVFTKSDEDMPGDLLSDLYILDEISDEDGVQRIFEEAELRGISLKLLPDDISPGDFAALVLLEHPIVVKVCHEKLVARQVKRYYEYRSCDDQRFDLSATETSRDKIKAILGPWFEEKKRTPTCELFVYPEGSELHILITHGALFRADGNITNHLKLSRLGWRPQKHDTIIYDTKTGILKIHASYAPERKAYREALGQVLTSNSGYFLDAAPYRLNSLQTNGGVLTLVDGLEWVCLTEVTLEVDAVDCRRQDLKGDDLTEMVAGTGALSMLPGEIVRACFMLRYKSGGRPRKLEVRLPNVADYNRDRDGDVTEAFLRVNGFLIAGDTDANGLVDAA
ncbi:MAG: hypothetical protein HQ504_04455 [Rhodospirillaceae bacterium]|nr:hypothetical protein [Rhodospirillaceae bacterium]